MDDEVRAGRFREDLFYRINVMHLHLPPLRARPEDVPVLANFFLAQHGLRLGISADKLPRELVALLTRYSWPGNVRELQNVLERALILSGGTPSAEHLPAHVRERHDAASTGTDDGDLSVKRRLPALERELIARALERTGGNRTRAAEMLDLSPRALFYKLQDYGLA
jgi:two-component system response regulator AtoC